MKKKWKKINSMVLVLVMIFSLPGCSQEKDESNKDSDKNKNENNVESSMSITHLRTQNLVNPLGIQKEKPVFSWLLYSDEKNKSQSAYRIVAASSKDKLEKEEYDIWDSGKVVGRKNYGIVYAGKELKSMQKVYWSVAVWDESGNRTEFSEPAYFEIGLLNESDWTGKWITGSDEEIIYSLLGKEKLTQSKGNVLIDKVAVTNSKYLKISVSESGPASIDEFNDVNLAGKIYRMQIMEVELYKEGKKVELPDGTKVVAKNTFSWASQWGTSAMLDGNFDQGYTSLNVESNKYDKPIEVIIEFGAEVSYDEIHIHCRTDSRSTEDNICPNYPKKYYYEVSNDGKEYSKIGGDISITDAPTIDVENGNSSAPILSKEFLVNDSKKLESARLYISGLGIYEAYINGVKLGENTYFNPGESDVRKTVYYNTYDILDYLNADNEENNNAVSFILGNAQYANYRIHQQFGRYYKTDDWRSEEEVAGMFGAVKGIAQVVLTYIDGTTEIIGTDDTWAYVESPITENSWYGGEDYDATLEIEGWNDINPSIGRDKWGTAVLVQEGDIPKGKLTGVEFEPIVICTEDTITSDNITVTQKKEEEGYTTYLVDMGRNGAGFPEITVNTEIAGLVIKMYPAEVDAFDGYDGHINQASCTQSASNNGDLIYDTYITKGSGEEVYHPRFSYHGYRYVEVVVPSEIQLSSKNFKGYILRTDNAKNGSFSSSDEILNGINVLTERSIESNMYGTFTDCPQIEKLGWLETPSLMFYSMAHTYDISSWVPKLVRDMVNAQYDNGYIAAIAPEYFKIGPLSEDLNWNGSIIFTTWQYYETYGNKNIFTDENYSAMVKYMDYLKTSVARDNMILTGQMGEWGEMTNYGTTPVALVETAAYYRMAVCMSKIAEVLGKDSDKKAYTELAEDIQKAFHKNTICYNEEHLYGNGTQSGYGIVLYSGIALEENKKAVVEKLVQAIESADYHLTSGEVGLKQVFSALAENGRSDIIYKMVTNDSMPSYKYFLDKGLTTLPEYWNFEDLWGTVVRSRNHAMMGHVKEWFTRYLAGISPTGIGYDTIDIKPVYIDGITNVNGVVDSVHGKISSEWTYDGKNNKLVMKLIIPVGIKATVYVPAFESDWNISVDGKKVKFKQTEDGCYLKLSDALGSGNYTIEAK